MTFTLGAPMSLRTRSRVHCLGFATAVSFGAILPEGAAAQVLTDTVVVTMNVPVSLSNLHSSIGQVQVTCGFAVGGHVYKANEGSTRVNVSGGAVNTTVSIPVQVVLRVDTSTPVGTTATYTCHVSAIMNNALYYLQASGPEPWRKVDKDASVIGTITW